MKKLIYLIFIFFYSLSFSQSRDANYSKFINKYRINEPRIKKTKNITENIIYLGELNLNNSTFYVITSFKTVKAALTRHGHSTVYIYNSNKKMIRNYILGLPEEIPFNLENNSLYFNYVNDLTKTSEIFILKIEEEIPLFLCVDPSFQECY